MQIAGQLAWFGAFLVMCMLCTSTASAEHPASFSILGTYNLNKLVQTRFVAWKISGVYLLDRPPCLQSAIAWEKL